MIDAAEDGDPPTPQLSRTAVAQTITSFFGIYNKKNVSPTNTESPALALQALGSGSA
jgi:hypothetical protein